MALIILSSFKTTFLKQTNLQCDVFILNPFVTFQVTKYVSVEAERILCGTCLCVLKNF